MILVVNSLTAGSVEVMMMMMMMMMMLLLMMMMMMMMIPSLKLTFSHLKMDGWHTIVSFWGPAYFQGRKTVSFREFSTISMMPFLGFIFHTPRS